MISSPRWRGDFDLLCPFCEWVRNEFPSGPKGYVSEDTDRIIRIFKSKEFPNEDSIGRFMDIELKHISKPYIRKAEEMTFGLKDALLRKADPNRRRYLGFYLLALDNYDPKQATKITVNGREVSYETLRKWMRFDVYLEPYQFPKWISEEILKQKGEVDYFVKTRE